MDISSRLQLYKELSDHEWFRQSHLLRMTNLCMVAATVLGTALVAVLQGFDYGASLQTPFLGFAALSGLALACALYCICRALIGYEYSHLPLPSELEAHHSALHDWYRANSGAVGNPDSAFDEYILLRVIQAVGFNDRVNTRRGAFVQKALVFLAISLVFLAATAMPYLLAQLNSLSGCQVPGTGP